MSFAENIKTLRSKGESDDDILAYIADTSPQHSGTIGELKKRGEKSSDVLDFLRDTGDQKQDGMEGRSVTDKVTGALGFGAAGMLQGAGETARQQIGAGDVSSGLKGVGDAIMPKDYDPASNHLKGLDPSTWGYAPRALLESSPGLASDLAAGGAGAAGGAMLGGPIGATIGGLGGAAASYMARNWGNEAKTRAVNRTGDENAEPNTSDKTVTGLTTGAAGVLNRLGLKGAMSGVVQGSGKAAVGAAVKAVGKGAAADGAANVAQEGLSQVGTKAGTDSQYEPERLADAGVLGAATGAALRTATKLPADINNAIKNRNIDPERATRLVERFDQQETAPKNVGDAYTAIENVKSGLKKEQSTFLKEVKEQLAQEGADKDGLVKFDVEASRVLDELDRGGVIGEKRLAAIRDQVGGTSQGDTLMRALEDHQTLNQHLKTGTMNPSGKTFGGGFTSNKMVNAVANPVSMVNSALGRMALGSAGVAGLSGAAQLATLGPIAAKALAAQGAVYGGLRAIDGALGNRNVTKEFTDRFRGYKKSQPIDSPSFRDAIDQTQRSLADSEQQSKADGVKAKETDKAYKLQAKAEATQAKQEEKAYGKPPPTSAEKAAQEDAMWAARDRKDAPAPNELPDDNTVSQALQAARLKQVAEKLAAGQKVAKAKAASEKQETPNKVIADTPNAEVADMRRGIQGIMKTAKMKQKALAEVEKPQPVPKADKPPKAPKPPKPVKEAPIASKEAKDVIKGIQFREKQKAKFEPAPEAPKPKAGSISERAKAAIAPKEAKRMNDGENTTDNGTFYTYKPEGNRIVVTHNGKSVDRTAKGVDNPDRYADSVHQKMVERDEAFTEAKTHLRGKAARHELNVLHDFYNGSAKTWKQAFDRMEKFVNSNLVPEDVKSKISTLLSSDKLRIGWKQDE